MEKHTMGSLMSALRKSKGMTQQDIADRLGISNKTVSKWECDDGYPDISMLPAIAEIYGVSVDELLKGEINNEEKQEKAVSPDKSKKRIELLISTASEKFKLTSVIALVLALMSVVLGFLLNSILDDYLFSGTAALIALCVSLILSVIAIVLEWFAGSRLSFSLSGDDIAGFADKMLAQLKSARSFITVVIGIALVGIFGSGAMWYAVHYDQVLIPFFAVGIAISLVISLILFFVIGNRLTARVDDEKVKATNSYNRKTALGLLIGALCVALITSGLIGGVDKITHTHKIKFDNEDLFNSYIAFYSEDMFPLIEKDENALTITVVDPYNLSPSLQISMGVEFPDSEGVIDKEAGGTEIPIADDDYYWIDTYIYTFDTKENMDKFIDNYCIDGAFLSNCSRELLYSSNCVYSPDYDKLTVKYKTGNIIDMLGIYAMLVSGACIAFDAIYIAVRCCKKKKIK